jgi:hypothetical protein
MATEQQLAQALSPAKKPFGVIDPVDYLQGLSAEQISLLGNTTAAPSFDFYTPPGLPKTATPFKNASTQFINEPGKDFSGEKPSNFIEGESFADQSARNANINAHATAIAKGLVPGFAFLSNLPTIAGTIANTFGGKQAPAPVQDEGTYKGVNPVNDFSVATPAEAAAIAEAQNAQNALSMQSMQDAQTRDTEAAQAQSISDQSNAGIDPSSNSPAGGFGEGQYAKGGRVNRNHLTGPDPQGPDDGYGALQGGEYVIKKAAVRKYGEGMLGKINAGKYAPRG